MKQSVMIDPAVGPLQAEWRAFCRDISRLVNSPDQLRASAEVLRQKACAYLDRPSLAQLKLMLACNLVLDLALHGWDITLSRGKVSIAVPNDDFVSPLLQKDRVRQRHLIERDAQLSESSVKAFIKGMERKRLTDKGWHSIYSVMRDGEELAAALRRVTTIVNPKERDHQLGSIIDPYLQIVTPDAICSETGLRLNDIWRYFRHTWVNTYRSVPGRNLMVLVRDRARPCHPVIGIAALASAVIQQSIRDRWIGWDSDVAIGSLCKNPKRKTIRHLLTQLRRFIKAIYVDDLIKDGILSREDLNIGASGAISRLQAEGEKAIRLHRKNPDVAAHKSSTGRRINEWDGVAETKLFRSKRCKQLAILLDVQAVLHEAQLSKLSPKQLTEILQKSRVQRALKRIVRFGKAERVGINMMDIMVCGAIAPYNALLGGKLVCLLLCSPEVTRAYAKKYDQHVSVIASGMRGKKVIRQPKLVLLCTTSLYSNGSSQYNRVKLPGSEVGGHSGDYIEYEKLGISEGFGSFHFSKESVRIADALLGRSRQGRKVNSIFGEGVNPLMRKMREALALIKLPSGIFLKHGNKRIVYGIPLASNFRRILLGLDTRPKYILPQADPLQQTRAISQYWIRRWLSNRIQLDLVLKQVASNGLAYPVMHSAQVMLPGEELPEMVRLMNSAISEMPSQAISHQVRTSAARG